MGKSLSKLFCAFAVSLLLFISNSVIAVERHVPSQYPTIQAAIDASANGDEVILADGTYTGAGNRNINFYGKTITLRSENGPTHCIIDCQAETICVADISSGAPIIDGFTIIRCSTLSSSPAIILKGTSSIIRNCIFTENAACIYCYPGPDTKVINCTFYHNTADINGGAVGISTNIHNSGRFTISNNIFQDNQPTEIDYDFHMCKSGGHPGTSVEFSMLQSNWQNQTLLTFENCIYGQDPCFVDANNNDFHLKSQGGRWDPITESWVADTITSPAIDAGNPADDWTAELWPHGGRINLGAYGGTAEASMSANLVGNIADFDHDNLIGLSDLIGLCEKWLMHAPLLDTDIDRDNDVDMLDFCLFSSQWEKSRFTVLPENLFFSATQDSSDPNIQYLTIENLGLGTRNWKINTDDIPGWISLSPTSGSLAVGQNEQISCSIDVSGLLTGQYNYIFQVQDQDSFSAAPDISVILKILPPGSGTSEDPYQISTAQQLIYVGADASLMSCHFKLMNDIDLAQYSFQMAVIAPQSPNPFTGDWNGDGFCIRNLAITGSNSNDQGLIRKIGTGGQVRNMKIENLSVFGGFIVGGLAGENWGTISNCQAIGIVHASSEGGGLVGLSAGGSIIENCYTNGMVITTGDNWSAGGLVGYTGANIANCRSDSHVSTYGNDVHGGGISGENAGIIVNCHATGSVDAEGYGGHFGGLSGSNDASIKDCYATGSIKVSDYYSDTGGLVGWNDYGTISKCYATGTITGPISGIQYSGGLVGFSSAGSITNSYFLNTAGPDNGYGEPLTDSLMKQQASFVGWDFVSIWKISEGFSYPYLFWETEPHIFLNKSIYAVDEPIQAAFINMPGNQFDWIGICEKDATTEPWAGVMIQWFYTDGTQTGTPGITEGAVTFDGMGAGDYEIRLFFNDGYDIQDRKFLKVQ